MSFSFQSFLHLPLYPGAASVMRAMLFYYSRSHGGRFAWNLPNNFDYEPPPWIGDGIGDGVGDDNEDENGDI